MLEGVTEFKYSDSYQAIIYYYYYVHKLKKKFESTSRERTLFA